MQKYHLRRKEKEITDLTEIEKIIENGKYITLALSKDNQPYVLTLSYGYDKLNRIFYFHTAKIGMKIDFIKANPKTCATIIENLGYEIGDCNHHYKTVVIFGTLKIVEDIEEKKHGLDVMFTHLEGNSDEMKKKFIKDNADYDKVCVLKMSIERITAKKN